MKGTLKFGMVLTILAAVILTGACPKKDAIREAAKASYRLPAITNDLILKVDKARDAKLITLEQERKFGEILFPIAQAEKSFVQAVKAAEAIYRQTGQVPAGELARIRAMLDDQIIRPFLAVLDQYKLLGPNASAMLSAAIAAARLALQTIGSGFGSSLLNLLGSTSPGSTPAALGDPRMRFA